MNPIGDDASNPPAGLPRASVERLLSLPVAETYKCDARTRVWRVVDRDGRHYVIKRFEQRGWRHRLAALAGMHPAQKESRAHDRLRTRLIPVVPLAAVGFDDGGRAFLVAPESGISVYNWLKRSGPADLGARRHAVTQQLGSITGQLIEHGFAHDDHKASNIVMDGEGRLRLIDVGGVRRTRSRRRIERMLEALWKNLLTAAARRVDAAPVGPTRADRLRFHRAMMGRITGSKDRLGKLASRGDLQWIQW